MTAQQPQREYIITEEELQKLMSWSTHKSPDVCLYERRLEILKQVKARPHPPAPRPPCEECRYQERIDAAARAATLAARAEATQGRKVITLCGSVKFWDEYVRQNAQLTLEGNIVFSCGLSLKEGYEDLLIDLPLDDVKKDLDSIHLCKINLSDEIFVLNVGGYIGDSTMKEIVYALSRGKRVRFLESLRSTTAQEEEK